MPGSLDLYREESGALPTVTPTLFILVVASPWTQAVETAERIAEKRLAAHVVALQSGGSRFSGTDGAADARAYVVDVVEQLGHRVDVVSGVVDDPMNPGRRVLAKNLVVEVGTGDPVLFVIAHLDSKGANNAKHAAKSKWRFDRDPAPGADDNASGSAALLEVLRVLSPTKRVVFVWSDAEELAEIDDDGFMSNYGADFLVGEAPAIAVDMFLRERPWGPSLRVYDDGRLRSAVLTETLVHATWIVAPNVEITRRTDPTFTWSDHGAFWARGLGGVLLIEDDFHHARYHRPSDRFDSAESFYSMRQVEAAARILAAAVSILSDSRG